MELTVGNRYETGDGRVYLVTGGIAGGYLAAVRHDKVDGSARLFYSNGQYVGSDADRDVKGAFSPLRKRAA